MLDVNLLNSGSIVKNNTMNGKQLIVFSAISFSSCSISLCMVIFYIKHLVKIEDWSALIDTVPAFASTILLVITIVLNVIVLANQFRKKRTG